jgi:hypothetical protein
MPLAKIDAPPIRGEAWWACIAGLAGPEVHHVFTVGSWSCEDTRDGSAAEHMTLKRRPKICA